MVRKTWGWTAGLTALLIAGCEAGGEPGKPAPAASISPTPPTSGDQAPPPTDASKGLAPDSTGGLSPTRESESQGKDAEGARPAGAPKSAANAKLSDEEVAEVKKLPGDEPATALAQKVCPISGENLGSMGTPVKVEADGKAAYLCCKGCKKDFAKDPKAALAKLGK